MKKLLLVLALSPMAFAQTTIPTPKPDSVALSYALPSGQSTGAVLHHRLNFSRFFDGPLPQGCGGAAGCAACSYCSVLGNGVATCVPKPKCTILPPN